MFPVCSSLVPVRAALTLLSSYDGKSCRVLVVSASPFLASLASQSRDFGKSAAKAESKS